MHNNNEWSLKENSIIQGCILPEIVIPRKKKGYKIGKNTINNLQLICSKNKAAIRKLKVDPTDLMEMFKLWKEEMENDKHLKYIDYETYNKLCSMYKLKKKSKAYFTTDYIDPLECTTRANFKFL